MSGGITSGVTPLRRPREPVAPDRNASTTQYTVDIDAATGQVLRFPGPPPADPDDIEGEPYLGTPDDGQDDDENERTERKARKPSYLRHSFDENLAEHMTDFELASLGADVLEGIEADLSSRVDWMTQANRAIDYLGLATVGSTETSEMGTVSKVWHSLIMEAAIKFWSNGVAEMLPANGPAKIRDDEPTPSAMMGHNGGPPLQDNRNDLAEALEKDFNHYLTTVDRSYYRDFSRMLFSLGTMGTEFRKVFHCPLRGRPVSEWVKGANLIVSNEASDLSTAGRVTERIMMWPAQVKRLQRSGWWRDIELVAPTEERTESERKIAETQGTGDRPVLDRDNRRTIFESYVDVDLAGFEHEEDGEETGLPLPYRVTVDKDSRRVLEVRRNWKENDNLFQSRERYVMYGLVPGLGFYYLGYAHIGGNLERTLTAMMRMMIDGGMFANFPGGLRLKGGRTSNSELRPKPGEYVEVDPGGADDIRKVAMALPYKDPSAVFAAFIEKLASDGRGMLGIAEAPVGEGAQNVPVGTMLAMVEQSTKVMAAVHKGLHMAQSREFELLLELFREDPEALWSFAKSPQRRWQQAEEFNDIELVPASDPNVPSQVHRIGLATASVEMAASPAGMQVFNQKRIFEDARRTIGLPVDDGVWQAPSTAPPPPNPAVVVQQMKNQQDEMDGQRKAAEAAATLQDRAAQRQSDAVLANKKIQATAMQAGAKQQSEAADREADTKQHGLGVAADLHQHALSQAVELHKHQTGLQSAENTAAMGNAAPSSDGFAQGGAVGRGIAEIKPMSARDSKLGAEMRQALRDLHEGQARHTEALTKMIAHMTAPRKIERDRNGRISGVSIDSDKE